jgi:hypothetical protein
MKNESFTYEIPNPIIEKKYVAFCDILGFKNAVTGDLNATISFYRQFAKGASLLSNIIKETKITIYSDSILIVGNDLAPVLSTVQLLWSDALRNNYLIRGGVAFGDYWSEEKDGHFLVVSGALVEAVELENKVRDPAVVLSDDIDIPEIMWASRFNKTNNDGSFNTIEEDYRPIFRMPLLHFRDRNIVNPFHKYWFASAGINVRQMLEAHPNHKDKYNWFLELEQAVADDNALIPGELFEKWVAEGNLIPPP